jgi:hypothetical protein
MSYNHLFNGQKLREEERRNKDMELMLIVQLTILPLESLQAKTEP